VDKGGEDSQDHEAGCEAIVELAQLPQHPQAHLVQPEHMSLPELLHTRLAGQCALSLGRAEGEAPVEQAGVVVVLGQGRAVEGGAPPGARPG
jgi:hypothetical protein